MWCMHATDWNLFNHFSAAAFQFPVSKPSTVSKLARAALAENTEQLDCQIIYWRTVCRTQHDKLVSCKLPARFYIMDKLLTFRYK